MNRINYPLLLVSTFGLSVAGCYAYAGPPRHSHQKVVVVKERPRPQRVVVKEKVVVKDGKHRRHHHHDD
jgi:hypothetical protein